MERITERIGEAVGLAKHCPYGKVPKFCNSCKCNGRREQQRVCPAIMMIDRLAAYEDTGLTPAEIKARMQRKCDCKIDCLLKEYDKLQAERDALREQLDAPEPPKEE